MATIRVELSSRTWNGNAEASDGYTVRRVEVSTSVDAMEAGRRLGAELESPMFDYLLSAECAEQPAFGAMFRGGYYEVMLPRCRQVEAAIAGGDERGR